MLPTPSSDFIGLNGLPEGFLMPQLGAGSFKFPLGGDFSSLLSMLRQQQFSQAQGLPGVTGQGGNIPGLPNFQMPEGAGDIPGSPAVAQGHPGSLPGFGFTVGSLGPQGFQFGGQPAPSLSLGAGPQGIGVKGDIGNPMANTALNAGLGRGIGAAGGATGIGWGGLLGLLGQAAGIALPAGLAASLGPIGGMLGLMSSLNSIATGIPGTFANQFAALENPALLGGPLAMTQEELQDALAAVQSHISTIGGPQPANQNLLGLLSPRPNAQEPPGTFGMFGMGPAPDFGPEEGAPTDPDAGEGPGPGPSDGEGEGDF